MAVTTPEPETTNTTEEAKQLILKEREERMQKCQIEMNEVLTKYKCTLEVKMEISASKIVPMVTIVVLE
jgi:hypothetical protein